MEIFYYDELKSTQIYLKEQIQSTSLSAPVLIYTHNQTDGIGSRGNNWLGQDGNLFFSFALSRKSLPDDLALQSSSIFFGFILKEVLRDYGSSLWVKWPNDFYIDDKKIGGTITSLVANTLICGIGLNITKSQFEFGSLDIKINTADVLRSFIKKLESVKTWKEVFIKYQIEFELSKKKYSHIDGQKISLDDAVLNEDGSITINGEKVYSLR